MDTNELTCVERQCASALERHIGMEMRSVVALRQSMRLTAYHEAGHVAAHMFTGRDPNDIEHVSIICEGENAGRVRLVSDQDEATLPGWSPSLKRAMGRVLLLQMLAGRAAEYRVANPDDREDILDVDSEEWDEERTDLFRAQRIAEILACRYMPAHRVLSLAAKWTTELFELPDVWYCVEQLSEMLLAEGTIDDSNKIEEVCADIYESGLQLPRWSQRLNPA